ncbi:MAG: hypothetical protein WC341_10795 [Bacteroidales bacterium]|jgi:hypothetical protein
MVSHLMNDSNKYQWKHLLCLAFILPFISSFAQDSLNFKGQFSAYTLVNPDNNLPWWSGGRYIPQLNFEYGISGEKSIDFEASANLYGNAGLKPFESNHFSGDIKPYRLWVRYSTNQFELRAGLQKINFGSASILRPLMWFDQIDPRDPLKLTDGVYSILARYYFLNNANIWVWSLYGNKDPKGWETFGSAMHIPEFGGRIQIPVPMGEAAFSYHHRVADVIVLSDSIEIDSEIPENRFGFDAKFDMVVGWWIEASWSHHNKPIGLYNDQVLINLGLDYTFGLGNGLAITYEQLIASMDESPFLFANTTTFSLCNLSYPIGMFDNLSTIIYYDWSGNNTYSTLTWQRQFNNLSLYIMGYINPKDYYIPTQNRGENFYAGSGIQLMLVFNH